MLNILYYICICFILIYMIHSIYIHFKTQFVRKNTQIATSSAQKQSIHNNLQYIHINKNENVEEKNIMRNFFKSLK